MRSARAPAHLHVVPGGSPGERSDDDAWGGPELLVALGLAWALSLGRVLAAFVQREMFQAEATLALFVVIVLPLLVAEELIRRVPRRRAAAAPVLRAYAGERNR